MDRRKKSKCYQRNYNIRRPNNNSAQFRGLDINTDNTREEQVEDKTDIPGFYFDPESKTYFRITPENRKHFLEKKRAALIKSERAKKKNCAPVRQYYPNPSLSTELLNREYQYKTPELFKRHVYSTRLKMLTEVRRSCDNDAFQHCQMMKGLPAFGSVVGAWSSPQGTVIYHESLKTEPTDNEYGGFISLHPLHTMTDLCSAKIRDDLEFVLYVGNPTRPVSHIPDNSSVVQLYHVLPLCDLTTPENAESAEAMNSSLEFNNMVLWSCAWNQNTYRIALGSEGVTVVIIADNFSGIDETKLRVPNENTFSVEFNQAGNTLYCGTNKGNLKCFDLRCNRQVKNIKLVRGLSYLKFLSSENHIIASCYDHKLLQVDLRTDNVVVEYMGHNNDHLKIPVSFSEKNDFLCSVGQDRFVRIWNLKNGNFLSSIPPVTDDVSCFPYAWFSEEWAFARTGLETALVINTGKDFITYC